MGERIRAGVLLSLVLAGLAFLLLTRFSGLDYGLPLHTNNDEQFIRTQARRVLGGNGLDFFGWPARPQIYAVAALGALFPDTARDDMALLQTGRWLSAIAGLLTVLVGYLLARTCLSRPWALLAGLLLTTTPALVGCAHVAVPTAFLTLLIAASILALTPYVETRKPRHLIAFAVCAALAVTTKFPALLLLAPLAYAVWRVRPGLPASARRRHLLLVLGVGLGASIVSGFDLFFEPRQVVAILASEAGKVHRGVIYLGFLGNAEYYGSAILWTYGWCGVVLAVTGFIRALASERTRLLAFGFVYLLAMCSLGVHWGRYLAPVFPFVCVWIVLGLQFVVSRLASLPVPRLAKLAIPVVALAWIFALTVPRAAKVTVRFLAQDTRALAARWIDGSEYAGGRFYFDGYTPMLPDRRRHPPKDLIEQIRGGEHEYVITSSYIRDRSLASPESHPEEAMTYRLIAEEGVILKSWGASHSIKARIRGPWSSVNWLVDACRRYHREEALISGPRIDLIDVRGMRAEPR